MKLFLSIVLATFSFAGTLYKTPVFTVEHSTLYCWQGIDPMTIVEYKPGDLLDGDHALNYCSYNLDTVKEKYSNYVNENKATPIITGFISIVSMLLFSWILFITGRVCLQIQNL